MALVLVGAGAAGLCLLLSPLEALVFGSIVSATDPVTVLAVFQRLGAHPDLYALIFGESVLNDAVAMVLFRSLLTFRGRAASAGAVAAAATFLWIFLGSMAIGGCGVAWGCFRRAPGGRQPVWRRPLADLLLFLGARVPPAWLGLATIRHS